MVEKILAFSRVLDLLVKLLVLCILTAVVGIVISSIGNEMKYTELIELFIKDKALVVRDREKISHVLLYEKQLKAEINVMFNNMAQRHSSQVPFMIVEL